MNIDIISWRMGLHALSCRIMALLALISTCSLLTGSATAGVAPGSPWFHNPGAMVVWHQLTALSEARGTNSPTSSWTIIEQNMNGTRKLYALTGNPQQLLVSDSTTSPVFTEIPIDWEPVKPVTSVTLSKWDKNYEELFLASQTGVRRLDNDLGQLVPIWIASFCYNNSCDPFFLASFGDSLMVSIPNWGGGSGLWSVTTTNRIRLTGCCGSPYIWVDPVSRRFGENFAILRVLSDLRSLLISGSVGPGGAYSFDGGLTYSSPAGSRDDGLGLYPTGFYEYSGTNIIMRCSYYPNSLFIGNVGGTMRSLGCPIQYVSTFFYSPSSRLLIAGDEENTNMYYTILPAPDAVLPELAIQNAVIVSWSTQFLNATIEVANSATGPWTELALPRTVIGNQIQVAVPVDKAQRFFRMLLP